MPYFRHVLQLQMDGNRISEVIVFKQAVIIYSNGGRVVFVCVCVFSWSIEQFNHASLQLQNGKISSVGSRYFRIQYP